LIIAARRRFGASANQVDVGLKADLCCARATGDDWKVMKTGVAAHRNFGGTRTNRTACAKRQAVMAGSA